MPRTSSGVHILLLGILCKTVHAIFIFNETFVTYLSKMQFQFLTTHINNNVYMTDYLEGSGDTGGFIILYSQLYFLLGLLGLVLLFTLIGLVLILRDND